jgi:hypothetical protein
LTSDKQERRSSSRRDFFKHVSFGTIIKKPDKVENKEFSGLCVNISERGLGMTTDHALKKGNIIEINLPVQNTDTTVPVFAEVKWSEPSREHFRVGLRFLA